MASKGEGLAPGDVENAPIPFVVPQAIPTAASIALRTQRAGEIASGLHARSADELVVPGGPHLLAPLEFLPKFSWAGWRWTKFMMDLTRAERVVLIVHELDL